MQEEEGPCVPMWVAIGRRRGGGAALEPPFTFPTVARLFQQTPQPSVRIDPKAVEFYPGDQLDCTVTLTRPVPRGQVVTVIMEYTGIREYQLTRIQEVLSTPPRTLRFTQGQRRKTFTVRINRTVGKEWLVVFDAFSKANPDVNHPKALGRVIVKR